MNQALQNSDMVRRRHPGSRRMRVCLCLILAAWLLGGTGPCIRYGSVRDGHVEHAWYAQHRRLPLGVLREGVTLQRATSFVCSVNPILFMCRVESKSSRAAGSCRSLALVDSEVWSAKYCSFRCQRSCSQHEGVCLSWGLRRRVPDRKNADCHAAACCA